MRTLIPEPLTKAAFAAFGDVIEIEGSDFYLINNGSTRRYHRLASVETAQPEDRAIISIFRAEALPMPLTLRMLERHPLGSQAFMPLHGRPFLIVVAPPGPAPLAEQIRAFVSDGRQGVNYHRGVWHHPVLALDAQDDFLVVDRSGPGNNCDEHVFAEDDQLLLAPHP
ncbi:ureidoglycolate lyase [Pseudomonas sp. RIT-PI-AD]|uniref:ureidoglycolate lyase n=1 Tax=Pseudomonas sp. RIT-PI-AD TaxID=3035294 RepID=UPI0021D88589|nr:ureidoglycolate lyase [Pseudomonas sp. RIT-PI-AD]